MNNLHKIESFKILEEHDVLGIKFLKTAELDTKTLLKKENVIFSDFMQGDIGNCGLTAVLASLSQRPEFSAEITPKIEQTSEGVKLQFNMFFKGKPKVVTIDDALPFDKNNALVYASSAQTITCIWHRFSKRHSVNKLVVTLMCVLKGRVQILHFHRSVIACLVIVVGNMKSQNEILWIT